MKRFFSGLTCLALIASSSPTLSYACGGSSTVNIIEGRTTSFRNEGEFDWIVEVTDEGKKSRYYIDGEDGLLPLALILRAKRDQYDKGFRKMKIKPEDAYGCPDPKNSKNSISLSKGQAALLKKAVLGMRNSFTRQCYLDMPLDRLNNIHACSVILDTFGAGKIETNQLTLGQFCILGKMIESSWIPRKGMSYIGCGIRKLGEDETGKIDTIVPKGQKFDQREGLRTLYYGRTNNRNIAEGFGDYFTKLIEDMTNPYRMVPRGSGCDAGSTQDEIKFTDEEGAGNSLTTSQSSRQAK